MWTERRLWILGWTLFFALTAQLFSSSASASWPEDPFDRELWQGDKACRKTAIALEKKLDAQVEALSGTILADEQARALPALAADVESSMNDWLNQLFRDYNAELDRIDRYEAESKKLSEQSYAVNHTWGEAQRAAKSQKEKDELERLYAPALARIRKKEDQVREYSWAATGKAMDLRAELWHRGTTFIEHLRNEHVAQISGQKTAPPALARVFRRKNDIRFDRGENTEHFERVDLSFKVCDTPVELPEDRIKVKLCASVSPGQPVRYAVFQHLQNDDYDDDDRPRPRGYVYDKTFGVQPLIANLGTSFEEAGKALRAGLRRNALGNLMGVCSKDDHLHDPQPKPRRRRHASIEESDRRDAKDLRVAEAGASGSGAIDRARAAR